MSINMEFNANKDFENWLYHLQVKYGEDFEILNGLHISQLDFSSFINEFIDHDVVADATIDSSANASMKDICSFKAEQTKSQNKLFAFHKIFYELHKYYDLQTARDWLENEWNGSLYLHNSSTSTFFNYCFSFNISRLAKEGLYFIPKFNNKPAKHLTTFIDHLMEFVSYYSNRSSGAVGIPSLLIWTWWFWKRDCETGYVEKDPDYYLRQNFQRLIYRINQCWIRINQPSFTNVSIYDRQYLEGVFGGMEYPDGTCVIDHIEDLIEHQKIFMDVVAEIRHHQMFTFPVISTMLMYKDFKFQDEEFAKWSCKRNMEWNDSNFFVSSNINILSSCCFERKTRFITDKGVKSFAELRDGENIYVVDMYGQWQPAIVHYYGKQRMNKITLQSNQITKEIIATPNHTWILTDESRTKNLKVGDSLWSLPENDSANEIHEDIYRNWVVKDISSYGENEIDCWCVEQPVNHTFTLESGVCTGNCRLLSDTKGLNGDSDTKELNSFINSIGGTAISIGSIQVNTINLMRIAYECNGDREKFFEILKEKTLLTLKSLSVIRHIIKRNIDKGLLPNFGEGGVEMDKCYSTIGM